MADLQPPADLIEAPPADLMEPPGDLLPAGGETRPDGPRWDVLGDIGRDFSRAIEGVKEGAAKAFPSVETREREHREKTEKYGRFSPKRLAVDAYDELGRLGNAAGAALSGVSTLATPITGAIKGTVGSAMSYLPGMNKNRADEAVDTALMGARAARVGRPAAPTEPQPSLGQSVREAVGPRARPTPVERPDARLSPGERAVADRMRQDVRGGGQTVDELLAEAATAPDSPLTLGDLGDANLSGLAGRATRAPGPGRQVSRGWLQSRDDAAGRRIDARLDTVFGEGSAFEARNDLMTARARESRPLYDRYERYTPLNPDEMAPDGRIGSMLSRPSVRQGMANARRIAAEEGVSPNTLGITLDAEGNVAFARTPTWRTLQFVKRGIDDVIEAYRDPVTKRLNLDSYGRAAEQTRQHFLGVLDDINPHYRAARDAWAGRSQSMDAMEFGRRALLNQPEENVAQIARMSASEREFARLGLKATMRQAIMKAGAGSDEARRIAGTEWVRRQARPFFRSESEANRFFNSMRAESRMHGTKQRLMGGSQTAERLAEDVSPLRDALGEVAHAGISAYLGHPISATRSGLRAYRDFRTLRDRGMHEEIARLLSRPIMQRGIVDPRIRTILDEVARQPDPGRYGRGIGSAVPPAIISEGLGARERQ